MIIFFLKRQKIITMSSIEKDIDNMFEDLKSSFSIQFSSLFHHVKVSQPTAQELLLCFGWKKTRKGVR